MKPKTPASRISLSAAALASTVALAGGCLSDETDGVTERALERAPSVQRWGDRDGRDLWPRGTRAAAVVVTPSTHEGTFLAYGVDATAGEILWIYETPRRDYASFSAVNAGEWRAISSEVGDFSSCMFGSLVRPGPNPPPVGEPPIVSTVRVILGAVEICIDAEKSLEIGY
jgi:hypothetical protein